MPPTFPVGLNPQTHPIQLKMNQLPQKRGAIQVTQIFGVHATLLIDVE